MWGYLTKLHQYPPSDFYAAILRLLIYRQQFAQTQGCCMTVFVNHCISMQIKWNRWIRRLHTIFCRVEHGDFQNFDWPHNFFALTTVENVSLQEKHSLLQSDHFLRPWLLGWRIFFPNVFVKIEKCCTVTSWVKIRVVRSRCFTFKNCEKNNPRT